MDEACALAGDDAGVPVIAWGDGDEQVGFFGPILTEVPSVDAGVRLFDAIAELASVPAFTELKRAEVPAGAPGGRTGCGQTARMDFSVWPNPQWSWDDVLSTAVDAEAAGWHGVWFADHFMPNSGDTSRTDGDFLECWGVLAALAATVPRVRLGSLVCSTTYRHPAVLANLAATVDHVSGGRLVLGLGAGWQINEHDAYGIELGR